MMKLNSKIYQVVEEVNGVLDESWYEYRVRLVDDHNVLIDEFDSLTETYNERKAQRLSKQQAVDEVGEIAEDVLYGNADNWFDLT